MKKDRRSMTKVKRYNSDIRVIIMLLSISAINTSIVGVLILIEWFTW